jgi:hypothetical protein
MLAEVAEFFGVEGEAGAEVRLFVQTEGIEGVSDEAEGVDVVGHELVAGAVFLMPFGVEAEKFGENERAREAKRAGTVEDFGDFLGRERFDFGKREADGADARVFEVFAGFDDFAGAAAIDERGEHGGELFDHADDVVAGHAATFAQLRLSGKKVRVSSRRLLRRRVVALDTG